MFCWANLCFSIFNVILQPPICFSKEFNAKFGLADIAYPYKFYFCTLKLVRWINLLVISSLSNEYFCVLILANPYL